MHHTHHTPTHASRQLHYLPTCLLQQVRESCDKCTTLIAHQRESCDTCTTLIAHQHESCDTCTTLIAHRRESCDTCTTLIAHQHTHDDSCTICQRVFLNTAVLQQHYSSHAHLEALTHSRLPPPARSSAPPTEIDLLASSGRSTPSSIGQVDILTRQLPPH